MFTLASRDHHCLNITTSIPEVSISALLQTALAVSVHAFCTKQDLQKNYPPGLHETFLVFPLLPVELQIQIFLFASRH
ncbi:hypothetical protein ONS95_012904 [Cadophora gregata]|uniref:uncharacterized protein n=1 Tax=Cadophora gregata TaxID=51156 RepID=UPI0026DAE08D|nr:uncharacterized protein ONS95_012904 [Cadophora gregata]KAK0101113.1 hypothetical protein ONS96_006340 [Cadophora gregata f. sp. sojae]KAK0115855.1 hypothetical protein ONS95_012904 [Cadophora gregata]